MKIELNGKIALNYGPRKSDAKNIAMRSSKVEIVKARKQGKTLLSKALGDKG